MATPEQRTVLIALAVNLEDGETAKQAADRIRDALQVFAGRGGGGGYIAFTEVSGRPSVVLKRTIRWAKTELCRKEAV